MREDKQSLTAKPDGKIPKTFKFNGQSYGKGRLVLAIVTDFVKHHPSTTYKRLVEAFPDDLHSFGIVKPIPAAKKINKPHNRFFMKDTLQLKDKAVAVCSDFGINNIGKFLDRAGELGYKIRQVA